MEKFNRFLAFLSDLWGPPGLTPELQRYCQREGVDAWALLDAARQARLTVRKKDRQMVQAHPIPASRLEVSEEGPGLARS